ncbi:MAG: 3-deoxy-D-manno-octulosonate 8-phosphate phosphatase [Nitrospirae bacterium]|jgi:3-deoxy-D-manno-octulosonate 8-phosphate phosphatase (KDO 8-P phosphatase)|nr:3-deoxy-D-manno-octulosonate 8-phosphate phosphatase [Nitrospirota bacterium]
MQKPYKKKNIPKKKILTAAKKIKLLILDVDGVLTDGSIILDNHGNELKFFHVRDGHGIKMLMLSGVHVALITGRQSQVVEKRADELGIRDVFQKCYDKKIAYDELIRKYSLDDSEIAYVGDDIVDIPILKKVGFPVVVADAHEEVKAFAHMITTKEGGRGAVREICDLLLQAKGLREDLTDGNP